MPRPPSVYDSPRYYEIAFSYRDVKREVDFIEEVISKYSRTPVRSVLELAAGSSPYMLEFSGRGYKYVGIELNKRMVAYSRSRAKRERINAIFVNADMRDFLLRGKVDMAYLLLGSLYLKSDEELIKHLKSVSAALEPGGLYILEGAVSFFDSEIRRQSWTIKEGDLSVKATYDPEPLDKKKGIYSELITLDVNDGHKSFTLEERVSKKVFDIETFLSLVRKEGNFSNVASFSNFNTRRKPTPDGRNILVLRKNKTR